MFKLPEEFLDISCVKPAIPEPKKIKQTITHVYVHRHSSPIYDDRDLKIKELQQEIHKLKQRISFLQKTEQYIDEKKLKDVIIHFTIPDSPGQIRQFYVETKSYTNQWAITLTLDPNKFPQIPFTPKKYQIRYFKKLLSYLSQKQLIKSTYGCFEHQQNGNIHAHFITSAYCIDSFIKKVQPYLTDNIIKKQNIYYYYQTASCAVKTIPSLDDLIKWLNYIEKDPVELFTDVVMSYDYDSIFI